MQVTFIRAVLVKYGDVRWFEVGSRKMGRQGAILNIL